MLRTGFIIIALLFISCNQDNKNNYISKGLSKKSTLQVVILPLGRIDEEVIVSINDSLQKKFNKVVLLKREKMPIMAYYPKRNRFRADSLLKWMSKRVNETETYVAITMDDISTTKGKVNDFGIMGLGYQPGNVCVASNFRLRNKRNFYKVVLHELGHTAGLPHCETKICFMRDAKGGDHTDEQKGFCESCNSFLKSLSWNL